MQSGRSSRTRLNPLDCQASIRTAYALAMLGERSCSTPEEFKAWSQNLRHEQVLTTLTSYGEVAPYRQAEMMRTLGARPAGTTDRKELARRFMELAVAAGLSESDRSL